jgi:hypothetical protein
MFPLALGMRLGVYLIARVVFDTPFIGLVLSGALLLVPMPLWMVLPRLEALRNR